MQTFSVGNTIFMILVGCGMVAISLWFGYDSIIHRTYRTGAVLAFVGVQLLGVFLFKMNGFLTEKGISTANLFSDNFDLVVEHARITLLEFDLSVPLLVWLVALFFVFVICPANTQKKM